jgi:ecotin
MKNILIIFSIASGLVSTLLAQHQPLDAFPKAAEDQSRFVIRVPEADDEFAFKVELIIGKTVPTDGVNRHFFAGKVEEKDLKGWGYSYFEMKELGPMAGTLMKPLPGGKQVDTFVAVNSQLPLQRYNSRMPIVVYVPKGAEVRYRIWKAGKETNAAQE